MQDHNQPQELIKKLRQLGSDKRMYPFPAEDCLKLIPERGKYYEDLLTLLDLYSIDMFGYSRFARRILNLSTEERTTVEEGLRESFFEKHPEYKALQVGINEAETPHLFEVLSILEKIRLTLLELLDLLKEVGNSNPGTS